MAYRTEELNWYLPPILFCPVALGIRELPPPPPPRPYGITFCHVANQTHDYLFCHVLCVERFDGGYIFTSQLVYICCRQFLSLLSVLFLCVQNLLTKCFVLTCVRVARVCNCYHQLIVSCADPNLESLLLLLLLFAVISLFVLSGKIDVITSIVCAFVLLLIHSVRPSCNHWHHGFTPSFPLLL